MAPQLRYALLELGLRCNLRCLHCAVDAGQPRPNELSLADWERVVEDLAALECPAVDLMGGEVLLSPLLPQVGALLQKAGIAWGLLTNGWLLDGRQARSLVDLGCRGFGVSLDGATAATHDELRGRRGSYSRALAAIEVVSRLDLKASNRAVLTSVSTKNLGELDAIGELLSRRTPGVRWQLNLCSALAPRFPPSMRLDAPAIARFRDFIAEARRSGRWDLQIGASHDLGYFVDEPALHDYRWEGCPAGIRHLGIQSDGLVKGCLLLDASFGVGRVTERRLAAIWNDAQAMARYREVQVDELGEGCRSCVWGAVCRGGCPSHSVAYTGRPHQHPHCLWRDASPQERARQRRPIVASGQRARTGARPRRTSWRTPLRSVCLELTRRCNLRCLHCGSAAGDGLPRELELEEIAAIIRDLSALGGERIVLLGGEPLLHRGWPRVVELAHEHGLEAALITNGLLVDAAVASRLAESGLTHVGLSLDGASDAVHDGIRGLKGARTKAWAALERLRAAGLPVTIITTVVRTNLPELEAMRDQLLANGPGLVWQIQAASGGGERFPADFAVRPADLLGVARFIARCRAEISLDALAVAGAHDIGYYPRTVRDFGTEGTWRGCPGGVTSAGIASDGSLKGCLSMGDGEIQGNVRERPLRKLWRDPRLFARNRFPAPGLLQGECSRCPYGALCRAGCPQMARTATGDVFDNPLCLRRIECAQGAR
jgi:radical SAM protein with 4Fe4S-binding SPASM domain